MSKEITISIGIDKWGCFFYFGVPLCLYAIFWWIEPEWLIIPIVGFLWFICLIIYHLGKSIIERSKE
jgi:hypothetical protein